MKIYFGGSIRGGRSDQELYAKLIVHLSRYGEVLTEHVSDSTVTHMGSKGTAQEIYRNDMRMLRRADVVVAEVTNPSLGVGYEVAKAETEKPVLCLYRPGSNQSLSAMMAGNPKVTIREYAEPDEAFVHIDNFFKVLKI